MNRNSLPNLHALAAFGNGNSFELVSKGLPSQSEKPLLQIDECQNIALPASSPALIDKILYPESTAFLVAAPGVGKSFLALDMGLSIAANIPWQGRETLAGGVFYICLEGRIGMSKRVLAWLKAHGLEGKPLPFYLASGAIDLVNSPAHAQWINEEIQSIEAISGTTIRLIVVDTLNRAFGGGDENGPKDAGRFLANLDRIRAGLKATTLILHHHGKDEGKGARGHSSFKGAADAEYVLTALSKGVLKLKTTKQKDIESESDIFLELKPVSLGKDANGREISSAVLASANAFEVVEERPKLSRNPAKAFETLKGLAKDPAKPVSIDDWKQAFWETHFPKASPSTKKSAFARAIESLDASGHIKKEGKNAYILA